MRERPGVLHEGSRQHIEHPQALLGACSLGLCRRPEVRTVLHDLGIVQRGVVVDVHARGEAVDALHLSRSALREQFWIV